MPAVHTGAGAELEAERCVGSHLHTILRMQEKEEGDRETERFRVREQIAHPRQYLRNLQFKTPQTVKDTVCSSNGPLFPENLADPFFFFLKEGLK